MDAILPILTLLLGQLLGYWFAVTHTKEQIAAEKRAEYASRFVGLAYANLRYLASAEAAAQAGTAVSELAVLGDQAAFFLSDKTAEAIDRLTSNFVVALTDRASPERDLRRDAWKEYKSELDQVRRLLRRELRAKP
jgi:hypothetical protein